MSVINTWFKTALWKRIMGAMVLGVIIGLLWGEGAESIKWIGDLFIKMIRMVVVPLVFATLISGIVSMGDPARLGSLGSKTLMLYMATTLAAIVIGLTLASVIKPGVGVDLSGAVPNELQESLSMGQTLMNIVPSNPIAALANGDILAVIFFALVMGMSLLAIGSKGKPIADLMDATAEAMIRVSHWVMEFAPFGVFALLAWMAGTQGVGALLSVAKLALTTTIGFVAHTIIVHSSIMKFMLKLSPVSFFRGARDAMLVAFSTSSSSATLPVTMTVGRENLGIGATVASTVLPLGATINMDGTALYVGVVTVFAAQVFGVEMGVAEYLIVAGATTVASIGTASVPGASLFMMSAVMGAIGISPEQIALVIGFILPFDRPLDMLRTSVNITGDLSVATAVAKWEGEFDQTIFDRRLKF